MNLFLSNIFFKTLKDKRFTLFWWSVGIIALDLMIMAFYPSIANNPQFNQILLTLPPTLSKAFMGNISDITSVEGYLNSKLLFLMMPFIFLAFNMFLGSESIAREEKHWTLDLLLSTPITRWRVVGEKFASLVVLNVMLGLAVFLSLWAGVILVNVDINPWRLLDISISLMVLGTFFGALSMALSSATGRQQISAGVTGAVGVAAYLLNALAPEVKELADYQNLSVFYYYAENNPLVNGLEWWHVTVLVAFSLVLLFLGIAVFKRRDLGV
jgi:ABC-2 type transport system permease protein